MASKIPVKVNRIPHPRNDAKELHCEENAVLSEGGSNLVSERETEDRPQGKQIMKHDKESNSTSDTSSVHAVNMSHQAQLPEIQQRNYKRSRIPSAIRDHDGKYISSLRKRMTNEAQKYITVRRHPDDKYDTKGQGSSMPTGIWEAKNAKSSEQMTLDEKDAQHAIVSNEYNLARNSNDMKGEEEEQMTALSKIPILRTDSPGNIADTQSTLKSHGQNLSRYSPRQRITPQQQQQISTKRLMITRQKSLTQIRLDHKYKSSNYEKSLNLKSTVHEGKIAGENNKKVRVRISTARSSVSTSTVNTMQNSVVSEEDVGGYSKEQELLKSVKVEPCVQAEGPRHVILPSGTSLTKALRTNSPDCDRPVRFVYKVPKDGYSIPPLPNRHYTPVINLSLNDDVQQSLSNVNPVARSLGLIKVHLKQNLNTSAQKSTNENVPDGHKTVKTIKLSSIPITRERQALQKYNTVDLFNGSSQNLFSNSDDESGKSTGKSRTFLQKKNASCTRRQTNRSRHQSNQNDAISVHDAHQIKFCIKSPEMDSVSKTGSKISVKVTTKGSKISL